MQQFGKFGRYPFPIAFLRESRDILPPSRRAIVFVDKIILVRYTGATTLVLALGTLVHASTWAELVAPRQQRDDVGQLGHRRKKMGEITKR